MKKLRFFLLLPLLFVFVSSFGQQGQDVVYLKDGSVIKGTVSEYIAGDHVRIQNIEGKVYEFQASEIKNVVMAGSTKAIHIRQPYTPKKFGYINNTTFGLMMGNAGYGAAINPSFQTINSLTFCTKYQGGLGIGMDFMNDGVFSPVFADFRYHFLDGEVSPYVAVGGGYAVPLMDSRIRYGFYPQYYSKSNGGPMSYVQLGLRNLVKPHLGYSLSLGYRFQYLTSDYDRYFWNSGEESFVRVHEKLTMHRVDVRIGILFN
jgi:hypothetical protein